MIDSPLTGLCGPIPGEIHLWYLTSKSDHGTEVDIGGKDVLSPQEKDRLASMRHPRSATRFLRGRILTRRVLGGYMSQDPALVELTVDAAGKPTCGSSLAFSLSHSDGQTILAVAQGGDIGVDIEALSKASAAMRIAREFYAPSELRFVDYHCGDAAENALMLWTVKESIVKARGETVWNGLERLALTINGSNIGWEPPPDRDRWCLAAGRFSGTHSLSIAYRVLDENIPAAVSFKYYNVAGTRLPDEIFELTFTS